MMPARLVVLVLALLVSLLAGRPAQASAANHAVPVVAAGASIAEPGSAAAGERAGMLADASAETATLPADRRAAGAPAATARRSAPHRDLLPRAPCLEGLLRPPCRA